MAGNTARNKGIRLSDIRVTPELKEKIEGVLLKEITEKKDPKITIADIRRKLYRLGLKAYEAQQPAA